MIFEIVCFLLFIVVYYGSVKSHLTHVAESDGSLAGTVHEQVALLRVELWSRDHLRQLLHVGRLDVHDVEGLVRDLHVPQIDPQVVCW